jgi:hypothetical protein
VIRAIFMSFITCFLIFRFILIIKLNVKVSWILCVIRDNFSLMFESSKTYSIIKPFHIRKFSHSQK